MQLINAEKGHVCNEIEVHQELKTIWSAQLLWRAENDIWLCLYFNLNPQVSLPCDELRISSI